MIDLEHKLKALGISKYKIRDDGGIVVLQDVNWEGMELDEIPIEFYAIDGEFNLKGNRLKNLKNFPFRVSKSAILSYNKLETLEGILAGTIVHGFLLDNNMLTSLKGSPPRVDVFSIDHNHLLESLEHAPSAETIFVGGLKNVPDQELAIYMSAISSKTWDSSLSIRDNFKALIRAFPEYLNQIIWRQRVSAVLEDTKEELRATLVGVKFGI